MAETIEWSHFFWKAVCADHHRKKIATSRNSASLPALAASALSFPLSLPSGVRSKHLGSNVSGVYLLLLPVTASGPRTRLVTLRQGFRKHFLVDFWQFSFPDFCP